MSELPQSERDRYETRIAELERQVAAQAKVIDSLGEKLLTIANHLAIVAEREERRKRTKGEER